MGPKLNSNLLKISRMKSIQESNKEEPIENPKVEQPQCPICFSNVELKIMSETVPCGHQFCE